MVVKHNTKKQTYLFKFFQFFGVGINFCPKGRFTNPGVRVVESVVVG